MKVSIFAFLFVTALAVLASHASPVQTKSDLEDQSLPVKDFFSELILAILKLTAGEFLKGINVRAVNVEQLINDTAIQFTNTYNSAAPASIKPQILALKNDFVNRTVDSMIKLWEPLRVLIPIISFDPEAETTPVLLDVAEIIRAILGITLKELLVIFFNALTIVHDVLSHTMQQLEDIANRADLTTADNLEIIARDYVDSINHKVDPILRNLTQILGGEYHI